MALSLVVEREEPEALGVVQGCHVYLSGTERAVNSQLPGLALRKARRLAWGLAGQKTEELSGFDTHHRYMPTEIHMPHSPEAREIREVALSGKKKLVSQDSEDL